MLGEPGAVESAKCDGDADMTQSATIEAKCNSGDKLLLVQRILENGTKFNHQKQGKQRQRMTGGS